MLPFIRFRVPSPSATVLAILLALLPAMAQAADPSPRVGRVSYIDGTISFHSADQTQWSYSTVNYPVTSGLSFWSEPQARAEFEIGSSVVRMDSGTLLDVLQLDTATTQIQIEQGTINYRVTHLDPGETIEIETPHGAVSLVQPGTYRIDAGDANTPTVIASLEGDARFIGPHSYLDIETGEQASAIGDPVSYTMAEAQTTPFDDWALQRDKREQESQTIKYVSPQVTGYQDLDQYGTWQPSPQYGNVWIPQEIPAGWAPYHNGHWAWVDPWGWTWIDDQPWGFAPFHYGRWARIDNRWAWVPGQVVAQPFYAPALVVFTGGMPGRPGVDLSISAAGFSLGAAIGWLALAPNEPYYPSFHASPRYLRSVNYGNVDNRVISNIAANRANYGSINRYANHGSATFVPNQAFTGAQSVQRAAITPPAASVANAPVATSLTALKPTAFSRAASPAVARASGAQTVAPGPSEAAQQRDEREIHQATPQTLGTQDKQAAEPRPATEQAVRPVEPAAEANHAEIAHPATPEVQAERPEATRHEARAEPAPHEPGTAPGPQPAMARTAVPLRQAQLTAALTHPAAQEAMPRGPEKITPARSAEPVQRVEQHPQAAAARAPAPVFTPAHVEKPVQSAPLHPTPAGWHREAPAPQAKAPAGGEKDKKDDEHK